MQLNTLGQALLAKDSIASVDGQAISSVRCSVACWLTDTTVIGQFEVTPNQWHICTLDLTQPNPQPVIVGGPAGFLVAAGGTWAAMNTFAAGIFGEWFSGLPISIPGAKPWDISPDGSALLICPDGQHGLGLQIWWSNGQDPWLYAGQLGTVACMAGAFTLWNITGGAVMANPVPPPKTLPLVAGTRLVMEDSADWIIQNSGNKLVAYPWGQDADVPGYVLSTSGHDYNPAVVPNAHGLLIGSSSTQGERPENAQLYDLDLEQHRLRTAVVVNGAMVWGNWAPCPMVPLAVVGPVDPPSGPCPYDPIKPPSTPIITFPNYVVPPQASYGRKGLSGPYFATSLRIYADLPSPGNFEFINGGTVTGGGNQQVDRPILPDLASVGNPWEKMLGLYGGANDDSMGNEGTVACWKWLRKRKPNAMLLRYFDLTPITQDMINACEREATIQVQCYTRAGEGISAAVARWVDSIDRVIASGRRCGVARGFDIKYGGLGLVLEAQDPLCAIIRNRPQVDVDGWFAWGRWSRPTENGPIADGGGAYFSELVAWANVLGGLYTGLPEGL